MYALVKSTTNPVTGDLDNSITLFTGTTQFEDAEGIGYTPSYLRQWSSAEKQQRGIYEVVYGTPKDGRFYNVVENAPTFENDIVTVTFTSTPKELEDGEVDEVTGRATAGLKTQYTQQFKQTANSMLAGTDWMVVRKIERDIAVPSETADARAAIVTEAARLETAISAVTTVEQLIEVIGSADFSV